MLRNAIFIFDDDDLTVWHVIIDLHQLHDRCRLRPTSLRFCAWTLWGSFHSWQRPTGACDLMILQELVIDPAFVENGI